MPTDAPCAPACTGEKTAAVSASPACTARRARAIAEAVLACGTDRDTGAILTGGAGSTAGCATDLARGTTVPVHAGLARGTATGRAAHLIIRAARLVEAGFARGTTHTGASAGVACEALAAITRSG